MTKWTTRKSGAAVLAAAIAGLGGGSVYGETRSSAPVVFTDVTREAGIDFVETIGDGVAIVPGRHLIGQLSWGPIKQDPNFWYLTGVETVYGVLVVSARQTTLFRPEEFQFAGGQYPMAERDRFRRAKWNLPGAWRLHPGDEAIAGVQSILPVDELGERLESLVVDADAVYLPLQRRDLYAPPGLAAPKSVYAQTVDAIRDRIGSKEIRDLRPIVGQMRLIKDAHEIAALRRAAAIDRKSTRLNSSHTDISRMPSSA